MHAIRKALAAACLAAFAVAVTAQDKKDAPKAGGEKNVAGLLEGNYTIVSGEEGGMPIPAERIKGALVKFTKDEVLGTDKDKKQIFTAKYKLDTTTKPWKITMRSDAPKEHETTGLIDREADRLRLIYALPGGDAPTEFKTKGKQQMFVLRNLSVKETKGKDLKKPGGDK